MNYPDMLEKWFEDGQTMLWRYVRATPIEKLEWKPAETSRSVRELAEEIVDVMQFNIDIITKQGETEASWEGNGEKRSIEQLETELREKLVLFMQAVRAFPDEKLEEKVTLPWGVMSFREVINYPYWNLMYHIGQIAYIQTLYGDKDMY